MKHSSVLFKVRSYSARVNLLFVQLLPTAQLAQQNHTRIANMQLKAKRPQRLKLIRSRLSSGALDKENYTNFLSPQDKNPVQLFLCFGSVFFQISLVGVIKVLLAVECSPSASKCVSLPLHFDLYSICSAAALTHPRLFSAHFVDLRIGFVEVAMTTMYRINTFKMGKVNSRDSLI